MASKPVDGCQIWDGIGSDCGVGDTALVNSLHSLSFPLPFHAPCPLSIGQPTVPHPFPPVSINIWLAVSNSGWISLNLAGCLHAGHWSRHAYRSAPLPSSLASLHCRYRLSRPRHGSANFQRTSPPTPLKPFLLRCTPRHVASCRYVAPRPRWLLSHMATWPHGQIVSNSHNVSINPSISQWIDKILLVMTRYDMIWLDITNVIITLTFLDPQFF